MTRKVGILIVRMIVGLVVVMTVLSIGVMLVIYCSDRTQDSNQFGSNCSSLGRFLVTKQHGTNMKHSFRLKGLDIDNQTALPRGLLIHSAIWLDANCWMKYIPLNSRACQGCVTITSNGMDYIWKLVNSEHKPLLLWNYCSRK